MAFGEMGIFVVSCVKVRELRSPRRAVLCCAVLCYRFVGSFRSRLVRWFVRSSRLVGSFVRSSRFCLLVHSLVRLAVCRMS